MCLLMNEFCAIYKDFIITKFKFGFALCFLLLFSTMISIATTPTCNTRSWALLDALVYGIAVWVDTVAVAGSIAIARWLAVA